MRKLHWLNGKTTYCRPHSLDKMRRDVATRIPDVTCQPCLKAMGLSAIVFKASSTKAKATIILPNGKRPVCLVEEFELKIENAPIIENDDPKSFIGKEPEPIALRLRLTEDGWNSLRKAILGK